MKIKRIFEELKKPGIYGCMIKPISGHPRHCETVSLNSECLYLDLGCKGCVVRKKIGFKLKFFLNNSRILVCLFGGIMRITCNECEEIKIIEGYKNYNFRILYCGSCMVKRGKVTITPFELTSKRLIADHLFICPACKFEQIMSGFKFCPSCGRELTFSLHIFELLRKELKGLEVKRDTP